jgi:serpin B
LRKRLVISSKEVGDLHFTSANGLFADQDTNILPFFSKLMKKNYKAKLASLDFGQSDQALQIINGWISNETKGKIPKLMESSDIDATTRLVLVNAVYFQGQWVHPFDPKRTNDQPFHSTEGDVTVSMMQQTSRFSYYETGSAQILALPFTPQAQGPRISCLIVLPQSSADGTDLELSSTLLKDWIDHLTPKKVTLTLPRFCLRTRFDLREALSQMGMAGAFTEKADFSGIDGTHDLYLSKVVHEAYFSLNESGVEAAAATGAAMNVTTAGPDTTPPILFTADHPFYFFLIDHESGALLFSGKLFHPDSSACQ